MYNVTKSVSHPHYLILKCSNTEKFKNDAYLAISVLPFLSCVVVVDA